MRKLITIFILIYTLAAGLTAKTVTLEGLEQPRIIEVDDNQLYITEKTKVHIYSLNGFKPVKTFGKEGEGPKEFRRLVLRFISQPDHLFINSSGKISYFKKDGTFIKESRLPDPRLRVEPFGKQFLVDGLVFEDGLFFFTVNIYNESMAKVKEIHRQKRAVQVQGKGTVLFTHPLPNIGYDNKVFIADGMDLKIKVLDASGKKLYDITRETTRYPITERAKKEMLEYLNKDAGTKPYLEMIKPIKFPEKYPAVRSFYVSDGKVYVFTYRFTKEPGKTGCLVFDTAGKFLKRQTVEHFRMDNPADDCPSTIRNGKLYWLKDNEETEEWELHTSDLK